MKAAILDGPGRLGIEEVELLDIGPGEIVVRTTAGLACRTDVIQRNDGGGLGEPHVRGHAGVGIVEQVGPGVHRVTVGDRVLVPTRPQCGSCFWCLAGQAEQCEATTRPGSHSAVRADGTLLRGSARVGSFADYMKVAEIQALPVQSSISDDELVTLGCGGAAGLGATLLTTRVQPGSSVLIVGAGVFGLSAIQGARIAGATEIIAIDPAAERRRLALAVGATTALDAGDGDLLAKIRDLTEGRGADVSVDCVGSPDSLMTAYTSTRIGGDVVCGGFGAKSSVITFGFNDLGMRGRRLLSCQFGSINMLRDLPKFVTYIERGDFDARILITARFPLDDLNRALDLQESLDVLGAVIFPK